MAVESEVVGMAAGATAVSLAVVREEVAALAAAKGATTGEEATVAWEEMGALAGNSQASGVEMMGVVKRVAAQAVAVRAMVT